MNRMMKKILTIFLLVGNIVSAGVGMESQLSTSCANAFTTAETVRLSGKAKEDYVAQRMYALFHPDGGAKPAAPIFEIPAGYIHTKNVFKETKTELLAPIKITTNKVILQFHGGGYVQSLGNGHRNLAFIQSQMAGAAPVYLLDYRIAPAYSYPAALEDGINAYQELLSKGYKSEDIIIIGDSAGGNLALATALYLKDHNLPQPGALVLISPWLMMENTLPSRSSNFYKDAVLGAQGAPLVPEIARPRYAVGADLKDQYLSPLYGDFKGLPPMLIQTGGNETLLDDSLELAQKAKKAGVKVVQTTYKGMPHDFAVCMPDLEDSRKSWEELGYFLQKYVR